MALLFHDVWGCNTVDKSVNRVCKRAKELNI